MTDPVMIYSSLMRLQIDRLNSIAENASNVNSTGYLQETNQIDPTQFLSLLQGNRYAAGHISARSSDLGAVNITNNNTDLALASDHWFVVTKDGKPALTRNGNFSISEDGELKLGNYFVSGEAGKIRNVSEKLRVSADGTLYVENMLVDKIRIVSAKLGADVVSKGNGIYEVKEEVVTAENPKVMQGALNNSNVNLEADMTRMIEITRHIESIQRAISAHDDMLDVGINQLGK